MQVLRKLVHLARRRPKAAVPKAAILLYQRVVSMGQDPWALAVSPEHFEEQMQYLARHRLPMFVDDIVSHLKSGTLPNLAVAVTLDDAYRDNLVYARPILKRLNIPATVFVPTGLVGRPRSF